MSNLLARRSWEPWRLVWLIVLCLFPVVWTAWFTAALLQNSLKSAAGEFLFIVMMVFGPTAGKIVMLTPLLSASIWTATTRKLSARRPLKIVVLAIYVVTLVSAIGAAFYAGRDNTSVSVPELDNYRISLEDIRASKDAAAVVRAVGEPALKDLRSYPEGEESWTYPVRAVAPSGWHVRAAVLRIQFNGSGVVSDWYYLNPRDNTRLPITDTIAEVTHSWEGSCFRPEHLIDVEASLRRQVTQESEIEKLLTPWLKTTSTNATGDVWDYYVDRPSAVFIPPFYLGVEIDPTGAVRYAGVSGYGGCE